MSKVRNYAPYLIQRGSQMSQEQQDRSSKKGIDRLASWDYMGSSEFEFGALGRALNLMKENKLTASFFHQRNLSFGVIHIEDKHDHVFDCMLGLIGERPHTKEPTHIDRALTTSDCDTDLWWDIKNGYIFWLQHSPEWDKQICDYFGVTMPESKSSLVFKH